MDLAVHLTLRVPHAAGGYAPSKELLRLSRFRRERVCRPLQLGRGGVAAGTLLKRDLIQVQRGGLLSHYNVCGVATSQRPSSGPGRAACRPCSTRRVLVSAWAAEESGQRRKARWRRDCGVSRWSRRYAAAPGSAAASGRQRARRRSRYGIHQGGECGGKGAFRAQNIHRNRSRSMLSIYRCAALSRGWTCFK